MLQAQIIQFCFSHFRPPEAEIQIFEIFIWPISRLKNTITKNIVVSVMDFIKPVKSGYEKLNFENFWKNRNFQKLPLQRPAVTLMIYDQNK